MTFLNKIEKIANRCYDQMKKAGSDFQSRMIARSERKYSHSAEKERIKFLGVPMLFLGNKFDLLHKMHNL